MPAKLHVDYDKIQEDYNNSSSWTDTAKKFGVSRSFLSRAISDGLLKSKDIKDQNKNRGRTKYNWAEIQKYYDDGHSWSETIEHFGVHKTTISDAVHRGLFQFRKHVSKYNFKQLQDYYDKGYTWQEISKEFDLSLSYIYKLASENKIKSRPIWSSRSYPEREFINALTKNVISGWVCEYRNGRYSYDIAFPELKIDIEIDGKTHNLPSSKESDARRDQFSKEQGWTVLRFPAKRVLEDLNGCIEELKEVLTTKLP